jgi:hypothetical protein
MSQQTVQGKLWELSIKACVMVTPCFVGFAVWLTSQIYTLKTQAALATQERATISANMAKDQELLGKIHDQQVRVLLTLERLSTQMEKILEKN